MKQKRIFLAAVVCAAAFFTACDTTTGGGDYGGPRIEGIMVKAGDIKYYSLSTGEAVSASRKNTTDWDIAFERTTNYGFRLVYTNSGASATRAGSYGDGGVWHTESTNFNSVSLANKQDDFMAGGINYSTDVARWGLGMNPDPIIRNLNVMTYAGYSYGTGEDEDYPFSASYNYDQKQFYVQAGEMGKYASTGQVYIVQHADGIHHSKIQIEYEYIGAPLEAIADVYTVRYENLD
jgi:hypothetical protein